MTIGNTCPALGSMQNTCHGDFSFLLATFIILQCIHFKLAPIINPCIVPKFCSIKHPSLKIHSSKMGCVFTMVICYEIRMGQYRDDYQQEDAPHFIFSILISRIKFRFLRFEISARYQMKKYDHCTDKLLALDDHCFEMVFGQGRKIKLIANNVFRAFFFIFIPTQ